MTADRAEWTGFGAALLFHVALIAAMSMSLASLEVKPEPPSMEVELVDEVGLEAAAPTPIAQPASSEPPSMPNEAAPQPLPQQTVAPLPSVRPTPQPPRTVQRPPAQPSRRPGLDEDFLKRFDDDLAPRSGPAQPAAPTFNAKARASVASSIARQAQRCADRQPFLGEGADQLQVNLRLSFARSGRLSRPPQITSISGSAELRSKYGDLLEDQVRRIFAECAPFRLPADLYDTLDGGWKETSLRYRVKQ